MRYVFSVPIPGVHKLHNQVTKNLDEALAVLKGVTSETSLDVTFYPLALFRVRPVTRCTASLEGHTEAVLCVSFSPDSSTLATGSGDTTVSNDEIVI